MSQKCTQKSLSNLKICTCVTKCRLLLIMQDHVSVCSTRTQSVRNETEHNFTLALIMFIKHIDGNKHINGNQHQRAFVSSIHYIQYSWVSHKEIAEKKSQFWMPKLSVIYNLIITVDVLKKDGIFDMFGQLTEITAMLTHNSFQKS